MQGFQLEDEDEKEPVLPDLPDGVAAEIVSTEVQAKKTSPPKPYTEGTLIDDMKNIAKFVTDSTKKARLKETSGIGTEATRANIIAKLCARNDKGEVFPDANPFLVTAKGKGKTVQIRATPKAMEFITLLEMHLPALADPAETAVWEEGLESVAGRSLCPDRFVSDISSQIRGHLAVLQKGVAAPAAPSGAPQGRLAAITEYLCPITAQPVLDVGDAWTFPGYPGFLAKKVFLGQTMTVPRYIELLQTKGGVVMKGLEGSSKKRFDAQVYYTNKTKFNGRPGLEMKFL